MPVIMLRPAMTCRQERPGRLPRARPRRWGEAAVGGVPSGNRGERGPGQESDGQPTRDHVLYSVEGGQLVGERHQLPAPRLRRRHDGRLVLAVTPPTGLDDLDLAHIAIIAVRERTRQLPQGARGVRHARVPYSRLKAAAEDLVRQSGLPHSIMPSTQFYWLLDRMLGRMAPGEQVAVVVSIMPTSA